jgi:deoxyadenosine/deoxycytidine kinase
VTVYEEPLDVWKERYVNHDGENILGLFYGKMKRWSFHMEVAVMTTRLRQLKAALEDSSEVVVVERSVFTDFYVFAPNLHSAGQMQKVEWEIYEDWYRVTLELTLAPLLQQANVQYIFLDTNATTCHERKMKRDRKEEKTMAPDYLIQLQERHESWLLNPEFPYPIHRVDGHVGPADVLSQVLKIVGK